jgi:O-antigen ligase
MQPLPAEVPNRMTERRALWKSALIEMDRHPIAGTSFRGINSRDAIYTKAKFFYPPLEKPMNAHNNFIEFGLRYGILFGILLLFTSIFGLYKAFRTRSLEILSFGIALVAVSMTESFLLREQGLSLASLMLLFYCLKENERNI